MSLKIQKLYCFTSVVADALTQVDPLQNKSDLLSRRNTYGAVTSSEVIVKYDNPSIKRNIYPPFSFPFTTPRAARCCCAVIAR